MNIGIYGGSFNPIHNGHIRLAEALLTQLDEVWFLVSPRNPLKQQSELADDRRRYDMVRMALRRKPRLVASDFEFALPRPSYTWNTLQALERAYPDDTFTLIIGGDNWELFDRWYRHEDILKRYHIIIYPRSGFPSKDTPLPSGVSLIDAPLLPISSTEIRQKLKLHQSVDEWVPKDVIRYIREHELYQ